MRNSSLEEAKRAKNDEFYTRTSDVAAELRHWTEHLRGKSVLCNCNDAVHTGFQDFFRENFHTLGLKQVVCTAYRPGKDRTVVRVLTADGESDSEIVGDGDFRSDACIDLVRQADLVITNPPFSLFREFLAMLEQEQAQFLIVGSLNALTYRGVFQAIRDDRLWLGHTAPKAFNTAKGWQKFGNIRWFTNLDKVERHQPLELTVGYSEADNPPYANYDAVEVSKIAWIPKDYSGKMGVPVSFLEHYCPEQFRIVGFSGELAGSMSECVEPDAVYQKGGPRFYIKTGEKQYKRCYDRIVIRRK